VDGPDRLDLVEGNRTAFLWRCPKTPGQIPICGPQVTGHRSVF